MSPQDDPSTWIADDPSTWPQGLYEEWILDEDAQAAFTAHINGASRPVETPRPALTIVPDPPSSTRLISRAKLAELPKLEPIVDGFLYRNTLARLVGEPGSYKSFLALDWACCIATGRAWHRRAVASGAVVYMAGEGASGLDKRMRAWEQHYNGGAPVELSFFPEAVNLADDRDEQWKRDAIEIASREPVLVVIDTQARYSVGADENSAKDMGVLVHRLEELRRFTGATVLLVHHVTRGAEHGRGSTSVLGAMQTELLLRRRAGSVELTTPKQKDSDEQSMPLAPMPVDGTDSMVLVSPLDADPLSLPAPPRVHAGSPVYERLARVLFETFGHGTSGATKAEARQAMQGDAELCIHGNARSVGRRFSQAWARLEELDALEQVEGLQRFKLTDDYAVSLELGGEPR